MSCCSHVGLYHSFHLLSYYFFFNHAATTEIYTLSLHDALPILATAHLRYACPHWHRGSGVPHRCHERCSLHGDRKSTRLNSSHLGISYAVFCLKKKNA